MLLNNSGQRGPYLLKTDTVSPEFTIPARDRSRLTAATNEGIEELSREQEMELGPGGTSHGPRFGHSLG